MTSRLEELRAVVSYDRQKLALYRAKVMGARPTSPQRLAELERRLASSVERLERAEAESMDPKGC